MRGLVEAELLLKFLDQLRRDAARAAIVGAGGSGPCFFRAPGGSYNATTLALARARGMSLVQWSNDPLDWAAPSHLSPDYQNKIFAALSAPCSTIRSSCCMTDLRATTGRTR